MSPKSGLMFPKPSPRKKKRKRHKSSILQERDGTCYLCRKLHGDCRKHSYLEEHHIFDGPDRAKSEAEGLKVYLCVSHHREGTEAAHKNREIMRLLQLEAQEAYERDHSHEEFMKLFGRNYL